MTMNGEVQERLREHAHRNGSGRWWFSSPDATHSEADALRIVQACMELDVPVTDIVSTAAWWTLVSRVAKLQGRVRELEHERRKREAYEMETRDRGDG